MNIRKLLAALLIAAMPLTPMAIMEELSPSELPEALEELAEAPVEATEAANETEIADAVDEAVEEEAEAEMGDAPAYEAQWEEADAVDLVEDSEADAAEKLMAPAGELAIDAAHFPDAAFRAYIASAFDRDKSGGLSDDERARVSNISLSSYNMVNQEKEHTLQNFSFSIKVDARSLQGIGSFPNLLSLECPGVSIGSLDLSGNPKLQFKLPIPPELKKAAEIRGVVGKIVKPRPTAGGETSGDER